MGPMESYAEARLTGATSDTFDVYVAKEWLKAGDRIIIRDGYEDAGKVGTYVGKSYYDAGRVAVRFTGDDYTTDVIAAAIKYHPLSRDEQIAAITEDYWQACSEVDADVDTLLAGVIDAVLDGTYNY